MEPLQFVWFKLEPEVGYVVEARQDYVEVCRREDAERADLELPIGAYQPDSNDFRSNPWQRYVVTARLPKGAPKNSETYDPQTIGPFEFSPKLWIALARVQTESDLLTFVSRYGPVLPRELDGLGTLLEFRDAPDDGFDYYGDAVDSCLYEAGRIREARDLWRALKGTDHNPPPSGTVARRMRRNLVELVNEELEGTTPVLLDMEAVPRGFMLFVLPKNLVAAAWVQFARAMSGNVGIGVCEKCGGWFELEATKTRKDRRYCSNACKQAAYRDRQQEERHKAAIESQGGDES